MKKLLLCSAAAVMGMALATPAKADGVKLDLAGHFKGYVTWLNQDTATGGDTERHFDILRETEIHFTGETTLDNGLTVGVHHEADIDNERNADAGGFGTPDAFFTEESYAYFSGAWGRVNFGKEDGANYLLQVAAPSADENFDGLRQYINPFNGALTAVGLGGLPVPAIGGGLGARGYGNTGKLDYANDATGYANKITYLTPVFSGFQAGISYTPDMGGALSIGGSPGANEGSSAFGVHSNDVAGEYGSAWDAGARYEGQWQNVGLTAGAGYTRVSQEKSLAAVAGESIADDFKQWNAGLNLNWGAFNLGGVYTHDNGAVDQNGGNRTWVAGLDWTTGPFKLGGSYLDNKENLGTTGAVDQGDLHTHRWAGGVVYTYGPGMTFRGSVGWTKTNTPDGTPDGDIKATDVLLGTQINF